MKKIVLSLLIVLCASQLFAQDKIYKNKGTVVIAKVIEIGTDEIKYRLFNSPDGPIYVIEKSSINRIEFADGRVEKYKLSYKDPENYEGQLGKAIKINFLSPLLGYTEITYEKSISPLKGYELGLGIIGAGKNIQISDYYINGQYQAYRRNAFGFFVHGGYKFNKLPTFFNKGMRMTHLLQGSYIKPTATIGFYSDHELNYKNAQPVIEKRNNFFGAVTLNFGKQWVFGEKILVDIFYGFGYAVDNRPNNINNYYYNDYSNHFAIQKTGPGTNFCLTGGIKVGLLIK